MGNSIKRSGHNLSGKKSSNYQEPTIGQGINVGLSHSNKMTPFGHVIENDDQTENPKVFKPGKVRDFKYVQE